MNLGLDYDLQGISKLQLCDGLNRHNSFYVEQKEMVGDPVAIIDI
jgi:hypothetical protein